MKIHRIISFLLVVFLSLLQVGCSTTRSVSPVTYVNGVRFEGDEIQEVLACSSVRHEMYSPLQWEHDGKYTTYDKNTWWLKKTAGVKRIVQGKSSLQDSDVDVADAWHGMFFPVKNTNVWVGLHFGISALRIVVIKNDVFGPETKLPLPEYGDEARIAKGLGLPRDFSQKGVAEKVFDPLLFNGNRGFMFRTFIPNEQYYEYDAITGALLAVDKLRVAEVKANNHDLIRVPLHLTDCYWQEEANGKIRILHKNLQHVDPVKDAVPEWKP